MMKCCTCGKIVNPKPGKAERLPMGWKHLGDVVACKACWRERYALRALMLTVSGAVDRTWDDLRNALRASWARSTWVANWAVTKLAANDIIRKPGIAKLPPMPPVYLYKLLPKKDKAGWSQSCAAVLRTVEAKYREMRYDTVWLQRASVPSMKYPYPYPFHNASWKAYRGPGGELLVDITMADERWTLRVRSGKHGRHSNSIAAQFDQIVKGEAIQGEAAIYQKRASGTHRNGTAGRDGGGQRVQNDVVLKLVAWFPRPKKEDGRKGVLFVMPSQDGLIDALNAKQDKLWSIHADHIWRWQMEYDRRRQNRSDDSKREERPKRSFASRSEAEAAKYHRRMDTAVKQYAAQIVNYAVRCKFAGVEWVSGHERPGFQWAAMKTRLKVLCDENQLEFTMAKEVTSEDAA